MPASIQTCKGDANTGEKTRPAQSADTALMGGGRAPGATMSSRKISAGVVSNTQRLDKPLLGTGYTVPRVPVLCEAPWG